MPLYIAKGHRLKIQKKKCVFSMKMHLVLANSAGFDEMMHYVAYHLGNNFLPKYAFRRTPIYRGSHMSAHVLLNLLNEFGKRDKMRGLPSILHFFLQRA